MKYKKFISLFLAMILVLSGILIFFPLTEELHNQSKGYKSPLSNGATYIYQFSPLVANLGNASIMQNNVTSQGLLEIVVHNGLFQVSIVDRLSLAGIQNYTIKQFKSYTLNSSFIKTFIDQNSGAMMQLGYGLIGVEVDKSQFSFNTGYMGNNSTLANYSNIDGKTTPTVVELTNFNSTAEPSWAGINQFPEEYQYDQVGNWNILVRMYISGDSGFLEDLYNSNGTTLNYVSQFSLTLIGTNVALGPLDYSAYLLEYSPLVFLLWAFAVPFILLLRSRIKRVRVIKKMK
ncbi:MAG: hypothetical protein ACYDAP_10120 [Thermoplasmataceae archaeon]